MKNLRRIAFYPTAQALIACQKGFLVKNREELSYYEGKKKGYTLFRCPMYSRKIVLSPDGKRAFLQNGLFSAKGFFFELDKPNQRQELELDSGTILLDCCYSEDGSFFYLTRDKSKTSLWKIRDGLREKVLDISSMDDRIGYSRQWNVLILFDRRGHFSFVSQGEICFSFLHPGSRKVYPYREGNLLLADSPKGFLLLSRSGKVLKRMDFLLPSEEKEEIVDFVLLEEKDRIFVLTKRAQKSNIYVFGAKDFALKEAFLDNKKEVDGIATDGNTISLKSRFGIELFSVRAERED